MREHKPKISLRVFLLIALVVVLMALIAWILMREDFDQMLEVIKSVNHLLVALAVATYFVSVVIWTVRWRTALSSIDCRAKLGTLHLILWATIFLNNITPGVRVGGDPFGRVYLLQKLTNIKHSLGMAASIGEHAFAPLFVLSLLMAGVFLQYGRQSIKLGSVIIAVWALIAFGAVLLPRFFFRRKIGARRMSGVIDRILGWLRKRLNNQEIREGVENFYSSVYATINTHSKGLVIGSLTLAILALDVLRFYIIFLALGYNPGLAMLLFASSLPVIVGLIPFLPGGLVLVEGSLSSVFILSGTSLGMAMAATVIERGISFVLSSVIGAVVFSYLGIRIAKR